MTDSSCCVQHLARAQCDITVAQRKKKKTFSSRPRDALSPTRRTLDIATYLLHRDTFCNSLGGGELSCTVTVAQFDAECAAAVWHRAAEERRAQGSARAGGAAPAGDHAGPDASPRGDPL